MLTKEVMEAIAHELYFWRDFVKTERFLKGWVEKNPTPELHDEVYDFLMDLDIKKGAQKVLDIGSGAVSILNGTVDDLVAVDPLGALYEVVFDYQAHGLTPPISHSGESIEYEEEFDVAHCSNAIDHSQNPQKVFDNMMKAVKVGGHVIIQGFEDEAVAEKWQGFHQWNFNLTANGNLYYTNKNENVVTLKGKVVYHIRKPNVYNGKTWFIWIVKK